jgi:hypothetical protein
VQVRKGTIASSPGGATFGPRGPGPFLRSRRQRVLGVIHERELDEKQDRCQQQRGEQDQFDRGRATVAPHGVVVLIWFAFERTFARMIVPATTAIVTAIAVMMTHSIVVAPRSGSFVTR